MAIIAPELKAKLKRDPKARVNLIVRLKDAPDAHMTDLKARGIKVHRTFTLIAAVAVQGSAAKLLALENESWVLGLEEDKAVHTLR